MESQSSSTIAFMVFAVWFFGLAAILIRLG